MGQQSIVLCLTRKGLAAVVIYEDLGATLGAEAISYPSVTSYLQEVKFAMSNPEVTLSDSIREHDDRDQAILPALDEERPASIPQLA
jgi:hypothetical protein